MAKSREEIQQLGLWDPQVSSPDHDAVCLWAYENADLIARKARPDMFDRSWSSQEIGSGWIGNDQKAMDLLGEFVSTTPRPNPRIVKRTLEYVLWSYTGYQGRMGRIVGYADILIETAVPILAARYLAGLDDILDRFEVRWSTECILVEAKSVLPTVGELMRQIQLYRTAFGGQIVVVSPDDTYEDILTEQGVTFVKYSAPV